MPEHRTRAALFAGLTIAQFDVLDIAIGQMKRCGWYLTSNRTTPLRVIRTLIARGLLREREELVCLIDPETGFSYERERWRIGYEATPAGIAAHAAAEGEARSVA